MSTELKIKAELRKTGKGACRGMRRDRQIPAVVYGPQVENMNISISEIDAVRYAGAKFKNTVFSLESDDKSLYKLQVIKKEMSRHPVSRRFTHIDFYAVDINKTVKVNVNLNFEGKSLGEKEGGILNILKRSIEIECLPNEVPENFTIDISNLALNDVLHVSDVTVPSSIKVITGADEAIASVAELKAEKSTAAPADEAATATAEAAPEKKD